MTHKVYVITDLGPGDGGKGGVVHAVAKSQRAHTIIKRGGAQGSHGVRTSKGQTFAFSQWGCGTFDGISTHISEQMIVSPEGLLNEAEALRREHSIDDPFAMLTVDERALVATPLHGIASHLLELSRGSHPRGTIGTGVGQAYRDSLRYPELKLTVRDLRASDLQEKLYGIRNTIREYLVPVFETSNFLRDDTDRATQDMDLLYVDGFVDFIYRRFREAASVTQIVDRDYLAETILPLSGTAVIETSHGILTDTVYGFTPHTSAIRTLPNFTRQILDDAGFAGKVVNLGVTRAYAIRHGAGPLPTNDPTLTELLLPGSHKQDNRWQGKVRVGALDGMLLRYAINVCGGPTAFDGLAVTWFDQILRNGSWQTCNSYQNYQGELTVNPHTTDAIQASLTATLKNAEPNIASQQIDPTLSNDEAFAVCAETVQAMTCVPVRMVSLGPTELDKLMK